MGQRWRPGADGPLTSRFSDQNATRPHRCPHRHALPHSAGRDTGSKRRDVRRTNPPASSGSAPSINTSSRRPSKSRPYASATRVHSARSRSRRSPPRQRHRVCPAAEADGCALARPPGQPEGDIVRHAARRPVGQLEEHIAANDSPNPRTHPKMLSRPNALSHPQFRAASVIACLTGEDNRRGREL